MRFSVAWARIASQNVGLKVATAVLGIAVLSESFAIVFVASKDIPVIERECYTRLRGLASPEPTTKEIKAFLLEALPQRFDSAEVPSLEFLSISEFAVREKEQAVLKQRQISQRILVDDVVIGDKEISVVADRIVAVGKVKSALALNLKVNVQKTSRSEGNPYGLILSSVSQIEEEAKK